MIDFYAPAYYSGFGRYNRRAYVDSANTQNDKLLIFKVDDTGVAFGCRLVFTMI